MFKKTETKTESGTSTNQTAPGEKICTETLRNRLAGSEDIVFNDININSDKELTATVIYVDGLVNSQLIDNFVLKPLIQENTLGKAKTEKDLIDFIMLGTVYHDLRKLRETMPDCINDILSGSVAVVFDNSGVAVTFEVKGFEKRGISEPTSENVLKGSKESFIEVLRVNTAIVRRRIQTSDLKMSHMTIGRRTRTAIAVVYLDGVANRSTVELVKQRIKAIDIDGITSAGQVEAFLLDNEKSFFPQILYTERADKFCGNILEGRVGVMIDGIPIAYIIPVDISSFLQAPEDYSLNYIVSSTLRILRYICVFSALILPAFYVSITTFHREMIPTKLALSIISSKQGVPFPTYMEVLLMLLAFEVLLEAGLRLPRAIGQTVSIVGALVVGQAAISANLLSPGVVIVISTAGITGFVLPSQDMSNAVRLCRLLLVFLSIFGGLFMVTIGLIGILYHLCSLEVFGVPYMSPYVANEGKQMFGDTILR
ncbi:MAG: spore germination protein, partial [Clostridia bacterium]|nr:spore germination protein [Clostridia bacterium]